MTLVWHHILAVFIPLNVLVHVLFHIRVGRSSWQPQSGIRNSRETSGHPQNAGSRRSVLRDSNSSKTGLGGVLGWVMLCNGLPDFHAGYHRPCIQSYRL